ncbi:cytochrome P450 [Sinimarinibacterium thermocellulolyticum]|uniref:Cytochrome P450 n=1 Tax=Sinimarinibacterium thermocellulolyticum TaxID=3170016 RepID=A0ABV2ADJ6_9GAMM
MNTGTVQYIPDHVAPDRVFEFDIYNDAQLLRDLHAGYARLHEEAPPVFYTPANGGHWVVISQDIITEIVKDTEHFSTRILQIPPVPDAPLLIPLNLDPPEHTQYRMILAPFFGPKSVATMDAELKAFCTEVVGKIAGKGRCDFVRDVAAPFPVTVFMRMMGLPIDRFDEFRDLAERFFKARAEDVPPISQKIIGVLAELLQARMQNPTQGEKRDIIDHLVDAKIDGQPVAFDKLISACFLLFLGGLDTVTNALSFGCRYLATRPDLQRRIREDLSLVTPFVEESLRLFGVVNTPRVVVKDCDRFGVRFREGDMLLNCLPAAGWDPSKNDKASQFDIDRKNRTLITFSTGPHLCIGHFLARSEMRTMFTEWIRQVGEFRLADGYAPTYRAGMVMSLESLPLRW